MKSVFTRLCALVLVLVSCGWAQDLEAKGRGVVKIEPGQSARGSFKEAKYWGGADMHWFLLSGAAGDFFRVTVEAPDGVMPTVSVQRISRGFSGPKTLGKNVDPVTNGLYQQFTAQVDQASKEIILQVFRGSPKPHSYRVTLEKVDQMAESVPWNGGGAAAGGPAVAASGAAAAPAVKRAPEPMVPADYFPKFPVVMNHPDLPQAPKLLAMYEELTKDWNPSLKQQAASGSLGGGKIKGTFFCEPNATGPAEVKFTPDAKSASASQVLLVRVKDASACSQPTTGMIVYGNGVMSLGSMTLEKGNLLPKLANGPAVFASANGEANWGDQIAANTMKVAFFTDPIGNTLRRMDEVLPSSADIARVRLMIPNVGYIDGQTQNLVFQSQSAGTFHALDGSFKASSELKAYPITADQLKIAEPVSVIFRFTQGVPEQRPAIALTLEGLTRIDTTQTTDLGPAGTYLFFGSLKPGQLPLAEETQPAPGTLAQYAEEAEKCALKPAIPVSWLLWGPDCTKKPDRIQAWSVDGKYRLTFTKLGKPVLEQFNSDLPGRSIAEWRAAAFSTDNIPQPKGPTELWRNGHLAYRGAFKGLNPDGAGMCGLPGDDTGKTEKCVYANGERVDAIYLARLEQKKVDATFAQREANFEAERLAAAEARAQAAREAAEKRRQLALAQQQQQQAKAQSRGALFGALLGAGLSMAGGADMSSLGGTTALQSMMAGSNTSALAGLTGLAAGGGVSSDPATAFMQITDKIMQAKTGTSLTTMQNNPVQAMLELKAKSDRDQQARDAAAAQQASIASSPTGSYAAPPQQQASPRVTPPSNSSNAGRSSISLQNGVYGIPENGYQITVTFGNGTLTVVEPNKTSVYTLDPRRPNTYLFTNPNNGIKYGLRVINSNTLEAFKPLENGGETAPTKLVQIRAIDTPPVAQVSSQATHAPVAPSKPTGLAKDLPCSANSIIWQGEKRYVAKLNELEGHSLLGTFQNIDNAGGHPIVELRGDRTGVFEVHGANKNGIPINMNWYVVANCDGTPFVMDKTENGAKYLLAFQYTQTFNTPYETGFAHSKKPGDIDLAELVIDYKNRKMYIYGERVKNY